MNFGIGFGFGVDGVEALVLCCLQLMTCATACMVQKHLSTSSRPEMRPVSGPGRPGRHVVQWWVLAFALAKLGMAACDFILAVMYFNETLGAPSRRKLEEIRCPRWLCEAEQQLLHCRLPLSLASRHQICRRSTQGC